MPWSDPTNWITTKFMLAGAPFAVRDGQEPIKMDAQRIWEKVITGAITAIVIGIGSWFLFVNDMRTEQRIMSIELRNIEKANQTAHSSIVVGHEKAMSGISDDLKEIKHELRAFRDDSYILKNGNGKH